MEIITLKVLDLYLDNENPRHEPISDREKIIAHLVKNEKIKALAKDISDKGLSPLDLPAVIKDKNGNYIVVEGNRRICALTILNDPELSPEGEKSYFSNLAEKSTSIPDKINCVAFESREEANIWIELRHNGEQGGVGVVTWNAVQKARFFESSDNTLALKLLDYAQLNKIITPEQRKNRILTTISRFIGNPIFRSTLGITTGRSEPNVKIDVSYEDFNRVLRKFFDDLLSGENNVTSRSKKDDWEKYAKKLKTDGFAPKSHTEEKSLLEIQHGTSSKVKSDVNPNDTPSLNQNNNPSIPPNNNSNVTKFNNPSPDLRKNIIPSDFKAVIKDSILKRVFDELRVIDCDLHTLAASLVCRAFLENIYSKFYEKKFGNFPAGMQTHAVLDKVIKKIEEDKQKLSKAETNALGALRRVQNNENNVLSPKTLGAFAHAGWYPDAKSLKREWDNISPIIHYLLKSM